MATANLGRVGFVNKGTYSGATAYKVNDVVVYNSGTYACIQANNGQNPTNTSYWQNWVADNAVHKTGDETIAGVKTFSSSPIVPVPTLVNQVISMGNIIEKTGSGLGYGTGSGGTVTQLTSKSTAVTLNKPSGLITMNNAALAANSQSGFVVNNSIFTLGDSVFLNIAGGVADYGTYSIIASMNASGTFYIYIRNTTGSSLSEAVQVKFTIIKGANS